MKTTEVPSSFRRRRTFISSAISCAVENGGRLIQDEDARVAVQGAEDLDTLLHADAHVLDAGVGVDGQPVTVGQLAHTRARRAAVEHAKDPLGP